MKGDLFRLNGLEEEIDDFEQIFEKPILRLSLWSRTQVSPISLFLGGISTQEIVKNTGKYNLFTNGYGLILVKQWNFWNDNIDRNLMNDRYDDQMAIYGNKIQEKLNNENIFIIGAGALGCEFLKTFSSLLLDILFGIKKEILFLLFLLFLLLLHLN